ncbi:hypothetical protein [Streptomyces sp. JJ36]|uniref:hypothetical protein n=1 Tax=Streptomyces sp. JJ36 TaxID=2736645 RepID=UPI001F2CA22A|nr:hypothetical protein [Streptomyces sp. JJ36]MCF6521952.1 hypothetical protein [Streptomyces sp. JJ36]
MITREHVRDLLESPESDATLIVVGGRAEVVSAAELDSDPYRGAVEITSRDDLADELAAGTPPERELDALASRLDAMAARLGA